MTKDKHTSLAIALTATTFLCTPAVASSLTPTLDALKSEAGTVLPSINQTYELSELSGDLPAGAVKVEIGDQGYYFTPSGDNGGFLTALAGTSAGMLQESSDGLFELDGKKYGFNVASIPDSAFSYSDGSESDYNFTMSEADAEGNLTTKYYKVDLKAETFATSKNVSWTAVGEDQKDAADVVAVKLPNDQTKYFKYTYTKPENYETITNPELVLAITDPAESSADHSGGVAVNNMAGNSYGDIKNKLFKDNRVNGKLVNNTGENKYLYLRGGAIYNAGSVGDIEADFVGNSLSTIATGFSHVYAYGGAIYNSGTIDNITGNFIGNYVYSDDTSYPNSSGGAIYNDGTIGNITGDFIGNYAYLSRGSHSQSGAIYNGGTIGNITGDFIGNYTSGQAAAIYNYGWSAKIGNITGDFIGNHTSYNCGAISTWSSIDTITGDFIGNYASTSSFVHGGAIENGGSIGNITGDFIGNYVYSDGSSSGSAQGGAVHNSGNYNSTIGSITADFISNYAEIDANGNAWGGAVYMQSDMTFTSGTDAHFMSGNYTKDPTRGKIYNAVYVENSGMHHPDFLMITFNTIGGGAWVINDNIESSTNWWDNIVNLALTGDDVIDADTGTTTQYVAMNNDIINARTVTVNGTTLKFGSYQHEDQTAKNWDGKGAFVAALNEDGTANRDAAAVTTLSLKNGVFDIANGYLETVKLKGYSATDSFMHIDVDTDNMSADMLNVAGNVEGVTKMIVHASSNADIRGKGEILFAQSENDTTGNEGSFVVSRVYKSPYLFDVKYDQIADNSNKWYFAMNDQDNPDKEVEPEKPDVPTPPTPELPDIPNIPVKPTPSVDYRKVAPEVIAYQGLPVAALEQTKGMVGNISRQVQGRRFYCPGCGFYDYYWNGEAFHNLWANAVYNTLRIKTPTDIDAEVWGLEAGGDLQHDLNNKLGLFLSYRKGNYDMNGDGKHHYSTIGSEIDIDSYLAGLYYRYDRNNWWTFATIYGGIQRVDLKTKDGIKSDTDGTEFGGSVELGYDYALNKTVYLTPSVGAFYTQVDYDDATDSAGKVAKYNTLRQLELEAGVKLTKAFVMDEGYANLYVKPSVVQTVTDGDEVRITGLGKVNTIDDQTLGRIEIGGRYGFTEQLSAYGWANHTFGDDYKASTFGLGLSYSW